MESMTKALAKMNLTEEFYFGKDLSNESNFLGEVKKSLTENLMWMLEPFITRRLWLFLLN